MLIFSYSEVQKVNIEIKSCDYIPQILFNKQEKELLTHSSLLTYY